MANYRTLFQDHHNIEQQTLKNSELLAKLQEVGKLHIHAWRALASRAESRRSGVVLQT
ncbi:hypothetical protein P2B10_21205 [Xanthomonas perforans]